MEFREVRWHVRSVHEGDCDIGSTQNVNAGVLCSRGETYIYNSFPPTLKGALAASAAALVTAAAIVILVESVTSAKSHLLPKIRDPHVIH